MRDDVDLRIECPCCGEHAHPDAFWGRAHRHEDDGCPNCERPMAELKAAAAAVVGEQSGLDSWGETA